MTADDTNTSSGNGEAASADSGSNDTESGHVQDTALDGEAFEEGNFAGGVASETVFSEESDPKAPVPDGLTHSEIVEDQDGDLAEEAPRVNPDAPDQPSDEVGSVEQLVSDLERVTGERDQYLDTSRRLQAEFENYRKAVSKRESEARARANESIVSELLPVLDACDGAVSNGAEDVSPILAALAEALAKQGLEKVEPVDQPFDPLQHEAVLHEPAEGEGGPTVVEVMRPGYLLNGKVVRPAMVKVKG